MCKNIIDYSFNGNNISCVIAFFQVFLNSGISINILVIICDVKIISITIVKMKKGFNS